MVTGAKTQSVRLITVKTAVFAGLRTEQGCAIVGEQGTADQDVSRLCVARITAEMVAAAFSMEAARLATVFAPVTLGLFVNNRYADRDIAGMAVPAWYRMGNPSVIAEIRATVDFFVIKLSVVRDSV